MFVRDGWQWGFVVVIAWLVKAYPDVIAALKPKPIAQPDFV